MKLNNVITRLVWHLTITACTLKNNDEKNVPDYIFADLLFFECTEKHEKYLKIK